MSDIYWLCDTCENIVEADKFNEQVDQCHACHEQADLSYAECGCISCMDNLSAGVATDLPSISMED